MVGILHIYNIWNPVIRIAIYLWSFENFIFVAFLAVKVNGSDVISCFERSQGITGFQIFQICKIPNYDIGTLNSMGCTVVHFFTGHFFHFYTFSLDTFFTFSLLHFFTGHFFHFYTFSLDTFFTFTFFHWTLFSLSHFFHFYTFSLDTFSDNYDF